MRADPRFPCIAIVDVPGKGKGVMAKEHIPRGTLIVSEKPRIILPDGDVKIRKALSLLSREDISFMLPFPCGPNETPFFGQFKHFTPCVGDDASGLCATICRVNHTCFSPKGSPNATYFWNVNSKEEELYAIKEIREGQEIEVSYMSVVSDYERPLEHLRRKYGFECSCPGCTRPAAEQLASEQWIRAYNDFVRDLPLRFSLGNPLQILKDIETQILIICEEGYTGEVGARAHDAFQLCAYYGDAASAQKWEAICRDCNALYRGPTSESFKKAKSLAAKPQDFRAWRQLGMRNLKGPSKQVLECSYPPNVETAPAVPNEASSSSVGGISTSGSTQGSSTRVVDDNVPLASTETKLSKGQKKKVKARAKKEAAKNTEESSAH